jgi:ATP-dependent Clp protease adaptor protein ClpS
MKNNTTTEINIEKEAEDAVKDLLDENKVLMLYNDDHNTFDHVSNCLQLYCAHTMNQALQCAYIVHYKGKCDVKHGSYDKLEPICTALLEHGLKAKIE